MLRHITKALVAAALFTGSVAQAGTPVQWRTDHFTGMYTANPSFKNFVYVPPHPHSPATLMVFLPGTGGNDVDSYTNLMSEAAERGYYVIGLAYRNTEHSPAMVGCWPGAPSFYFQQQVEGTNNGFWSDDADDNDLFPELNSVSYRLHEILATLAIEHPWGGNFDWNQFWDGPKEKPLWSRIVVAGHSQGGELALWIAKNEAPMASIVFDAAYDRLDVGPPTVGLGKSPWNETSPDCNGHRGDVAPSWITPGAWTKKVILIDAANSTAYDGSWAGHHIEKTAQDLGKTKAHEIHLTSAPASLTASWYTSSSVTGCGGHSATSVDGCTPAWIPQLWDLVFDKAYSVLSPALAE